MPGQHSQPALTSLGHGDVAQMCGEEDLADVSESRTRLMLADVESVGTPENNNTIRVVV